MQHAALTISLLLALGASLALAGSAEPIQPATAPATAPETRNSKIENPQHTQYYLGLAVENLPPSIARHLKLRPGQGLLVTKVIDKSPAANAKLQANDLLVSIDGKPATSQRQLVEAANKLVRAADGTEQPASSSLVYLRDGERASVSLTPAPRPPELQVLGNASGFTPASARNLANNVYSTPAGGTVQVGPGYMVDLSSPNAGLTKSIQGYMSKGQTIVLSQETDTLGNLRQSITVGDKTYDFDAATVDQLPRDLQDLARPLVGQPRVARTRPATAPATPTDLEKRVADQQREIDSLKRQVDALLKQQGANTTPQK